MTPQVIALRFGAISAQWAQSLHPCAGSLVSEWPEPNEQVELRVSYPTLRTKGIGAFEVYGTEISVLAVRVDGIDGRELFLNNNRAAFESAFIIELVSRLLHVPAQSVHPLGLAVDPANTIQSTQTLSGSNPAMLVKWSRLSRGLEFEFLLPLDSDVGVNLLSNRRARGQFRGRVRDVNLPVNIEIFDVRLPLVEINTLSAGDVLLGLNLRSESFVAYVRSDSFFGKHPTLLTLGASSMSLSPYEIDSQSIDAITNHDDDLESDSAELHADLETNPKPNERLRSVTTTLKIDCVLSGLTMSLNDLQSLESGHVLTLPVSPLHVHVDLRLGEQIIGRGRLTTVNDLLAVQVVETYLSPTNSQTLSNSEIEDRFDDSQS